jgi:O-antigen/teichoic acid export membrane protein
MSKITRNILYNGLGTVATVLLGFVAVRFVFRSLGGDALGLIAFAQTLAVTLTVALQLGITQTAVREVASHHGKRPEYLARFIRTSSLLYWGSFVVLALLSYILAPYLIHHWVKLDSLDVPTATAVLRILSFGTLLSLPRGLYASLVVGLERMEFRNGIDVAAKALQQFGIFGILYFHGSVFQVAYWISACFVAQLLAHLIVCARFFPLPALLPGFFLDVVKENMRYASGLMTLTLCAWALDQGDRVILSKLLSLTALGLYSFVRSAVGGGMLLTGAINAAIFPHFARLHGGGDAAEMKISYHKIQDLICFATVIIFAAGPFVAIPILSRVFNMPAAHMLLLPLTLLCIGYYMNGTLTTPYAVSLAVGRPDITARIAALSLLVVIPTNIIAIYFFGLNGAGFSWVLYHIFYYAYGMPKLCRQCLGMEPRTWFQHVIGIMVVAFLTYGSAWVVLAYLGEFTLVSLALAYGGATALFCAISYKRLSVDLRLRIWGYFSKGAEQCV